MSFVITFETDASSYQALLIELQSRISPLGLAGWLSTTIDPFIRLRIDNRFKSEGDDVTGAWKALTPTTQSIRAAKGFPPSGPINRRYGQLHSYLVGTHSDIMPTGYGARLIHPPPGGSDWRTNIKLKTAQQGKGRPSTPARPVLGFNENDALFMTSDLTRYLMQGII